jgi:hypothetical protein
MGYLKETGQLTPEWRMKLESAINAGWQRLLTFEAKGGGFDWYSGGEARTLLTAYGILLLSDMDRVYPIDRRVIERARDVLYNRQAADGSWALDVPIHTWHQMGNAALPVTAYVTWALREAGFKDANVGRAMDWLQGRRVEAADPYVRALVALAVGDRASIEALENDARVQGDQARWETRGEGLYHARGETASIEATALAALALLKEGRSPLIDKALTAIARSKDSSGSWQSTQATILCIKALLEATKAPAKLRGPVAIRLLVDGREVEGLKPLTAENYDVVQQVEIPVKKGENVIDLALEGEARLSYQIFGRYYLPWALAPEPAQPVLEISTRYDKTELTLADRLKAVATLRYHGPGTFMVIADLGIPPGFTPDTASFEELARRKVIDKFSFTGRQITLYFGRVEKGRTIEIEYTLSPRFPIRAKAPRANAYEYYSPQNEASGRPQELRVAPE